VTYLHEPRLSYIAASGCDFGFPCVKRILIIDRDVLFASGFLRMLEQFGIRSVGPSERANVLSFVAIEGEDQSGFWH